jgi:hypothetical protein
MQEDNLVILEISGSQIGAGVLGGGATVLVCRSMAWICRIGWAGAGADVDLGDLAARSCNSVHE